MIDPLFAPGPTAPVGNGVSTPVGASRHGDFASVLRRESVRFSKHAEDRLQRDGITLSDAEREQLQEGLDKAAAKGGREALVLFDDKAFIANVREKIVITSMSRSRLKENVFTQIDCAVIIDRRGLA